MNVKKTVNAYLCNSCGACKAVCPTGAIKFHETSAGYVHPIINEETCIDCGLCERVCPGLHGCLESVTDEDSNTLGQGCEGYLGTATNNLYWRNGQSGGAVSAVLEYLFTSGTIKSAVVTELSDQQEIRGRAIIIRNISGILPSQKSRYTPIPLIDAISNLDEVDFPSAIVALPCQIHGLLNIFSSVSKYKRSDFILLGLFCQHVMTAAGIDYLLKNIPEKPDRLVFRDTESAGFPGNPTIRLNSTRKINLPKERFGYVYSELTPLRCYLCVDKSNQWSDISFGDPHRIKKADKKDKLSAIIARSTLGKKIISASSMTGSLSIKSIPASEILEGQRLTVRISRAGSIATLHEARFGLLPDYMHSIPRSEPDVSIHQAFNKSCHYASIPMRETLLEELKAGEPKKKNTWILRLRGLFKEITR